MYTFGETPYPGVPNVEIVSHLTTGHRLGRPRNCDPHTFALMSLCWSLNSAERPSFSDIVRSTLNKMPETQPVQVARSRASTLVRPISGVDFDSTPLDIKLRKLNNYDNDDSNKGGLPVIADGYEEEPHLGTDNFRSGVVDALAVSGDRQALIGRIGRSAGRGSGYLALEDIAMVALESVSADEKTGEVDAPVTAAANTYSHAESIV
eukprot:Opistho-2@15478